MCTNPFIIVYDKGGTVEVCGEGFKLIGLFCLLFLHVSIIFLNLQPPKGKYKNTRSGLARHVMGTIFLVNKYYKKQLVFFNFWVRPDNIPALDP